MSAQEDISAKIAFINLVKKHSCLWNTRLQSYSRADVTSLAWKDIAKTLGVTEHNCRERWKNIRTAFGRSMRTKLRSRKSTKAYYLAEHMSFLMPFLRRNSGISTQHPEEDEDSTEDNTEQQGGSETAESIKCSEMDDDFDRMVESLRSDHVEWEIEQDTPKSKKIKLITPKNEANVEFAEWVDRKERIEMETSVNQQDPDWMFFQSMLPDFKKLDDRRKRTLKAKFLLHLNDQLDAFEKNASN